MPVINRNVRAMGLPRRNLAARAPIVPAAGSFVQVPGQVPARVAPKAAVATPAPAPSTPIVARPAIAKVATGATPAPGPITQPILSTTSNGPGTKPDTTAPDPAPAPAPAVVAPGTTYTTGNPDLDRLIANNPGLRSYLESGGVTMTAVPPPGNPLARPAVAGLPPSASTPTTTEDPALLKPGATVTPPNPVGRPGDLKPDEVPLAEPDTSPIGKARAAARGLGYADGGKVDDPFARSPATPPSPLASPAPAPAAPVTTTPAKAAAPIVPTPAQPTSKLVAQGPGGDEGAFIPLPPTIDEPQLGPPPALPGPQLGPPPLGPNPDDPTEIGALDGTKPNEVWVLPKGQVVGYGGKLDYDVNNAFDQEWGADHPEWQAERQPQVSGLRARLAQGGLDVATLRKNLNDTAQGAEHNLFVDPLDDRGYTTRTYRAVFGREPTAEERTKMESMLSQGVERQDLLDKLKDSEEFKATGKTWDQAAIDKYVNQGDTFKGELKDDDLESELAGMFKSEIGRDPTARELAKYADAVRAGTIKRETTDHTTPQQVAATFYKTLFGEQYQPSAEEMQMVADSLANAPDDPTLALRQLAAQRRLGADYRTSGRNVSDNDIVNAVAQLRSGNTNSQYLEMLRARKTAGFKDGGRVKAKGRRVAVRGLDPRNTNRLVKLPKANHLPVEDGGVPLAKGGRVSKHALEEARETKGGRKDRDIFMEKAERFADGGQVGFQIPYSAYVDNPMVRAKFGEQSSEGGSTFQPVSEQQWNAMSNQERYATISGMTNNLTDSFSPDESTTAAFRQQFGNEGWQANASGRPQDMGRLIYGFGDPRMGVNNDDPSQFAIDPSRIMKLPDGRWVMEASNVRGDWLAQDQATDDRHGNQNMVRAAAALGIGAAGALGAAGEFGAAGSPYVSAGEGDIAAVNAGLTSGQGATAAGAGGGFQTVDVGGNLAAAGAPPPGVPLDVLPAIQQASGGAVSTWQQALAWAQANPAQVARLGLGAASLLSGGQSGSPVSRTPYTPGAGGTYAPGAGGTGFDPGGTPSAVPAPAPGAAVPAPSPAASVAAPAAPAAAPVASAAPQTIYMGGGGTSGVGGGSTMMGKDVADSSDPITQLLNAGKDQISRYHRYDPIERQLIDEAGRAGNTTSQEEQAALAGEDVAGQFDRQRGMLRRSPGIDPARAAALGLQLDVGEGGSKAYAMNAARRAERDSGFGKRIAALGLGDNALKTGLGAVSGGVSALLNKEQMANQRDATAQSTSVAMSNIGARMAEAEQQRALDRERLLQQQGQFNSTFGEGQREYDTTLGEGRRRYDTTLGEDTRRYNQNYNRGVYTGDRDFDFNVWRTNQGLDRQDDATNYARNQQQWNNIGAGVRTGLDLYNSWNRSGGSNPGGGAWDLWGNGTDPFSNGSAWMGNKGGRIRAKGLPRMDYAAGGEVRGPGDGTVDTVPAVLADGEHVVNAEATAYLDKVSPGLLEAANKKGLAIRAMRNSRAAARGLPRVGA